MPRGKPWHEHLTLGGRVPWAVGMILALTVVASLAVAFGSRHVAPLLEWGALVPANVWRGQVWRLVTWPFLIPGPLALLFTCLFYYWFGRELAAEWGSRRFLLVFGGVLLLASIGTCLLALLDRPVLDVRYVGGWEIGAAMIVAWGLCFPQRVIRIGFVIPIRGYVVAWLTVALSIVFAVYDGWKGYLPELLAEAAILGWLFRRSLLARWSGARLRWARRRREAQRHTRAARHAGSVASLRLVEANDDDTGPMAPELEGRVGELLERRGRPEKKDPR